MNFGIATSPPILFDLPISIGLAWTDRAGILQQVNDYWRFIFEPSSIKIGKIIDLSACAPQIDIHQIIQRIVNQKSHTQLQATLGYHPNSRAYRLTFTPLFQQGECSSVMIVAEEDPAPFSSSQKLNSRIKDRTNKLHAIFDVIAVATEAHEKDIGMVLQGCLEQVIDSTHASGGAIQLLNIEEEVLELKAYSGLEEEIVAEMRESSAESGLFGWTAAHHEQLILPDLVSDWRTSKVIRNSDIKVYAGVPMHSEGELVGVLSIFREKKHPFNADDISILASIADQIGVIISNHRLRAENDRLMVLEERNRLARELHDAVTQSLYSSVLLTEALKTQSSKGNLDGVERISKQLQSNAHQALKEMRLLIHNLRPAILSSVGLTRAIRHRLKAVEERAGIAHKLTVSGQINIPRQIEETLYFVTQEALNNSLKHAKASLINVTINLAKDVIRIKLVDDGCGFDPDALEEGGLGLISMAERMHQIGGEVHIDSAKNRGTSVELIWRGVE